MPYIKGKGYVKNDYKSIFIKESIEIHKNKYDYSLVNYIKSSKKVDIICPEHGVFQQTPQCHKKGQGCPECGKKSDKYFSYTFEEFKEMANKVHNNKYEYPEQIFRGSSYKIKILCSKHGEFEQRPYIHLRQSSGCPRCINKKITTEDFIRKSKEIHKDKYDYSLVKYTNNKEKVKLICKTHGVFKQAPNDHLSGYGCFKCGVSKRASNKTKTHRQFITQAMRKTNSIEMVYWFDYYRGNHIKFNFYCPKCTNIYPQTPNNHINGNGCPNCSNETKSRHWLNLYLNNKELGNIPGVFYKLKFKHREFTNIEFIKVGITRTSINHRYNSSQYSNFTYEVMEQVNTTILEAAIMENDYLCNNRDNRYFIPNPIKFNGRTECFRIN